MKQQLILIPLLAVSLWAVSMYATCPYDGEQAAFTGEKRDGGRSCEYRHMHAQNGGFVEHRFWTSCE